jgi:hypothetical protein
MFSDLLTFQTPKLAKASMVVAHLQLILKMEGRFDDASRLEGLEVTSRPMAEVAFTILQAMRVDGPESRQTHAIAIDAIRDALSDFRPQAASAN